MLFWTFPLRPLETAVPTSHTEWQQLLPSMSLNLAVSFPKPKHRKIKARKTKVCLHVQSMTPPKLRSIPRYHCGIRSRARRSSQTGEAIPYYVQAHVLLLQKRRLKRYIILAGSRTGRLRKPGVIKRFHGNVFMTNHQICSKSAFGEADAM